MQHICNMAGVIAAVAWETHSEVTLEETCNYNPTERTSAN